MDYPSFFAQELSAIKAEGRYRTFLPLQRDMAMPPESFIREAMAGEHSTLPEHVTVWCANDYLGMGRHPLVVQAMQQAAAEYGAGAGGTRNIAGTTNIHQQLEEELASLHGKPAALLFGCGYLANTATLGTLGQKLPGCIIFSDEKNHASMIEGIRISRAPKHIFQHNNVAHLEELLKLYPKEQPKVIAFESVYSMDGDIAPIAEICALAKKHGALTYLDEVHAVGLYGAQGGGVAEQLGITSQVDIIQGTLAKGFGVVGGYITSSRACIDYIRSNGAGFIFTTALPPAVAAAALASVRHVRANPQLRTSLHANAQALKNALAAHNLPFIQTPSHIVPFVVGNAARCKQLSDALLTRHSIYAQPINYPTVPRGTERLRLTPSPFHTQTHISRLVEALVAETATTAQAA